MKELTIEEKAKAYDEAVCVCRKLYNKAKANGYTSLSEVYEQIFPSLNESEDDKIRKELIEYIKDQQSSFISAPDCRDKYEEEENNKYNSWIAWLEKLGEQTIPQANERVWLYLVSDVLTWKDGIGQYLDDPRVQGLAKKLCNEYAQKLYTSPVLSNPSNTGKDEPKFHDGEWIVYECGEETTILQIIRIVGGTYVFSDDSTLGVVDEDTLRLWDITKDAKDGDMLATENFIFIFKNIDNGNGIHYYCHYEISKHEDCNQFGVALPQSLMGRVGNSISHYSPATKEQRDTLMKAMANAGYTFDFKKKELKKINQNKTPVEGEFPYDNPSDTLEGEIENIWGKLSSGDRFSSTKEGFREVITHFANYIKEQDDLLV